MPNPRLLKTAARLTRKGFALKNRLLSPYTAQRGDITLYVLRQELRTKKFVVLASVQKFGQDVESTQFRNRLYFEVAETEPLFGEDENKTFGEVLGVASHVAIVPNGEIFSIREGDELQILQTDFTYKIYGEVTGQKFNLATDV